MIMKTFDVKEMKKLLSEGMTNYLTWKNEQKYRNEIDDQKVQCSIWFGHRFHLGY